MARPGQQHLPPFAESIILITISGRCLSYLQQCNIERVNENPPWELPSLYEWLDRILPERVQSPCSNGGNTEPAQPLHLFASMVAQATTILLYTPVAIGCQERALRAARIILHLAQQLTEFSYFKVITFTILQLSN